MEECIFCKIVSGQIPCSKVYESETVLAFDDIHPVAPVHVIVVPKKHIPTLMDVTADTLNIIGDLMSATQQVAKIKGIDQKGFKAVINCKEEGGQVIFHLHMHIVGGKKIKVALV